MATDNIIEDILSGNIAEAKSKTDELLYSKLMDSLAIHKEHVASSTFDDAVGIASLVEKKKNGMVILENHLNQIVIIQEPKVVVVGVEMLF